MKIKEKILRAALQLFNEKGVDAITTRHIAAEIGISHGNLHYHFYYKKDIVIKLYEELVEKLNEGIERVTTIDLIDFMETTKFIFETLYEYRFLLIDFVHINRNIPELKTSYRLLTQKRKEQLEFMIHQLLEKDMIQKSILDIPIEYIQMQITILGDFWISEAEILYTGKKENLLRYFVETFLYSFYPHLTQKGKKIFMDKLPTLFIVNT